MSRLVPALKSFAVAGLAFSAVTAGAARLACASAAEPASGVIAPKPTKREIPVYPKGAQQRGIEGWVLIEFTVDEQGDVVAPRVIEGAPPGIFDSAALEAITAWKYSPRRIDATPVATPNLRVKLTFELK